MKTFLKKFLLFSLIFYLFNSFGALYLERRLTLNIQDRYHWYLNQSGKHFDIAFVGSSRVYNTIDPEIVDEKANVHSVNLGMGGAGAADNYLLLKSFLNANHVDLVLLQVDHITLSNCFSYPFRDYIWLSYDSDEVIRQVLIEERGRLRYLIWKLVPFYRLIEFSTQYKFFLLEDPPKVSDAEQWHGVDRLMGIKPSVPSPEIGAESSVLKFLPSQSSFLNVKRILQLCRDRNVRVVIFQSPFAASIEKKIDREISDKAIAALVEQEGTTYWDFSRDYYADEHLFFDTNHLNDEGVTLFSNQLAERVQIEK